MPCRGRELRLQFTRCRPAEGPLRPNEYIVLVMDQTSAFPPSASRSRRSAVGQQQPLPRCRCNVRFPPVADVHRARSTARRSSVGAAARAHTSLERKGAMSSKTRISDRCGSLLFVAGQSACLAASQPPVTVTTMTTTAEAASKLDCAAGSEALSARSASMNQVEPTLSYLGKLKQNLSRVNVTILSGRCTPLVQAALLDKIGFSNGNVYQIEPEGIVPWQSLMPVFEQPKLDESAIPEFPNAQFVQADDVGWHRTETGLAKRYVGLWRQAGSWLVADFKVLEGGKTIDVQPLLSSSLPLRSVSFFPAPDTPSGSLWLVQEEPSGNVRLIRLGWRHGN